MKSLLLTAILTALPAGAALAAEPRPFTPSLNTDVRPWEGNYGETRRGMGARSGRAALPGKDRLLVVDPNATTQVFVTNQTQVYGPQGQKVTRDQLREGDQVRVDYDFIGNTLIARRVTIYDHESPATP